MPILETAVKISYWWPLQPPAPLVLHNNHDQPQARPPRQSISFKTAILQDKVQRWKVKNTDVLPPPPCRPPLAWPSGPRPPLPRPRPSETESFPFLLGKHCGTHQSVSNTFGLLPLKWNDCLTAGTLVIEIVLLTNQATNRGTHQGGSDLRSSWHEKMSDFLLKSEMRW